MPWLQIDDWLAQHREQLDEVSLQQHLAQVDQRIGRQQYGSPPESRTTRPGPRRRGAQWLTSRRY